MEVKLFDGFESYLEQIHAVEEENLTDKVRKFWKKFEFRVIRRCWN